MNVMTRGRIQFANANNIPAINRYLILLFDKHNEKADIANARNGIFSTKCHRVAVSKFSDSLPPATIIGFIELIGES